MGNCHTIKCPARVAENTVGIIISNDLIAEVTFGDVTPAPPEEGFEWIYFPAYHYIDYACSNYPFKYQYQPINTKSVWIKVRLGMIKSQVTDALPSALQSQQYRNYLPAKEKALYVSFDPKLDEAIRCTNLDKDNSSLIVFCLSDDYSVNYQNPASPSPFLPQINVPAVTGDKPNVVMYKTKQMALAGFLNNYKIAFAPATLSYPEFVSYIVSNYWHLVQTGQIKLGDDKHCHKFIYKHEEFKECREEEETCKEEEEEEACKEEEEECKEESSQTEESSKKDVSFSIPEEHKHEEKHKEHKHHHKKHTHRRNYRHRR